jgi:hypothetical protein
VVVGWAIAQTAFTAWFVPLDWQRYFMPLVPPACLLAGIGVGWFTAIRLTASAKARRSRSRMPHERVA